VWLEVCLVCLRLPCKGLRLAMHGTTALAAVLCLVGWSQPLQVSGFSICLSANLQLPLVPAEPLPAYPC